MGSIYLHSDVDVRKPLINDHNLPQVFEVFYLLMTVFSGILYHRCAEWLQSQCLVFITGAAEEACKLQLGSVKSSAV